MEDSKVKCPICNSNDLVLRREASYVYSYKLDSDKPGLKNSEVFLSYEYDKRENTNSREYVECNRCGTQFPYKVLCGIVGEEKSSLN